MHDNQPSDQCLLERIAGRDRVALAALYDRHAAAVMAVAILTTGKPAAAEAVVEQVFWAVWQNQLATDGRDVRHRLLLDTRRRAASTPASGAA